MNRQISARQISAQAIEANDARDLTKLAIAELAEARAITAAANARRTEALAAIERVTGDLIAELTEAQSAYFGRVDHDDELWADVVLAEARLAPYAADADELAAA